ncbi:MAG TPA: hypothetical protein VF871_02440, partial [Burkholderiales bacterium]
MHFHHDRSSCVRPRIASLLVLAAVLSLLALSSASCGDDRPSQQEAADAGSAGNVGPYAIHVNVRRTDGTKRRIDLGPATDL